jgi:hypothetical protein
VVEDKTTVVDVDESVAVGIRFVKFRPAFGCNERVFRKFVGLVVDGEIQALGEERLEHGSSES